MSKIENTKKHTAVLTALIALIFSNQYASGDESVWRQALEEGKRRLQLRELEQAQGCFEQAVKESKRDRSVNVDDRVLCLESLANVLQLEDITQEALPKYKKSLHMLKKAHGDSSIELLPTLESLGQIHYLDGQYENAIKYYEQALAVIKENGQTGTFAYALVTRLLGQACAQTHVIGQTESWYDQSLTTTMSISQIPDDLFLEGLLSDYIDIIVKANESHRILSSALQKELLKDTIESYSRTKSVDTSQWNKSVSLNVIDPISGKTQDLRKNEPTASQFDKVLDIQQKTIPIEKVVTAASSASSKDATLARINKQREEFYERMIATDLDSLGPNHPSTARDLTGLAYVYISEKRLPEAKPLLERALSIYKNAYGADPLMVKRAETMLSAIDSTSTSSLESSRDVNEILASLKPVPIGVQKMEVALRLNYLALLYYSAGNLDQAAKIYAWALTATANACGDRSAITASCLYDYARLLRSQNNVETAKKYEAASAAINDHNLARRAALSVP
ncbi:MAG: tetratricopeptide repeat protein [Candidatus Obscuribacterales bacterium]|nr:tetratricopeptide repeat protein [Candidatus Obscuribacterales bacterium]